MCVASPSLKSSPKSNPNPNPNPLRRYKTLSKFAGVADEGEAAQQAAWTAAVIKLHREVQDAERKRSREELAEEEAATREAIRLAEKVGLYR